MAREKPENVGCRVTQEVKERYYDRLEDLGVSSQEYLEKKVKELISKESGEAASSFPPLFVSRNARIEIVDESTYKAAKILFEKLGENFSQNSRQEEISIEDQVFEEEKDNGQEQNQKKLCCPSCGKEFEKKSHLERHRDRRHRDSDKEDPRETIGALR